MGNILFWFRNDLRVRDNQALLQATSEGKVVPVYVIDQRLFGPSGLGFNRTGVFRAKFLLESLAELKNNLKQLGSDLVVKFGIPEQELFKIAVDFEVEKVIASKEVTQEETNVESALYQKLKTQNIEIDFFWSNTLIHVRDLPFQIHFVPDVFTDFRKKVENAWRVREEFPVPEKIESPAGLEKTEIPSLSDLGFNDFTPDQKDLNHFIGGENQALCHLNEFIWEKDLLKTYKETRNQMLGKDYSSKLSPYLSLGCISPRTVYFQVKKYEAERVQNESTYWLIFELLWKDYFYFIALKFGIRMFKRCGIKHDLIKTWKRNKEHFKMWMEGRTGVPIIDAVMVELKTTGYISNRGRQLVASFFTKDLNLEWWWGAMYFESQLVDYEVCSNWGNWNYIAGIGTDPRHDRYFNPIGQAKKYDPEAKFIKYWLPQLSGFSAGDLINIAPLENIVTSGTDYPSKAIPKNKRW
jgi:deoxyribodipyrimidine photo-lyase